MPTWFEELLHAVTGRSATHSRLPDLRPLDSERVAIERTHFLVDDPERRSRDDRLYVLRREPNSGRDADAVAVFSNGRSVGYLSQAVAAPLAPLLDKMGGAAIVNGAGPAVGSLRLWVDVSTRDALREYARA